MHDSLRPDGERPRVRLRALHLRPLLPPSLPPAPLVWEGWGAAELSAAEVPVLETTEAPEEEDPAPPLRGGGVAVCGGHGSGADTGVGRDGGLRERDGNDRLRFGRDGPGAGPPGTAAADPVLRTPRATDDREAARRFAAHDPPPPEPIPPLPPRREREAHSASIPPRENTSRLPTAREVLAAQRTARLAPQPTRKASGHEPLPTIGREPAAWKVPLRLGWLPAAAAAAMLGGVGMLGAWSWSIEAEHSGVVANRLARPGAKADTLPHWVRPPDPKWWKTTPGHLTLWCSGLIGWSTIPPRLRTPEHCWERRRRPLRCRHGSDSRGATGAGLGRRPGGRVGLEPGPEP